MEKRDITGKRFGKLVVLSFVRTTKNNSGYYRYMWKCKCDCGNEKVIDGRSLVRGSTKSCGCITNKWDRKSITQVLKKSNFKNLADWQRRNGSSYNVAKRKYPELIKEFFPNKRKAKWLEKEIRELLEKSKYKTVNDWNKDSGSSYNAARKFYPNLIEKYFPDHDKEWDVKKIETLLTKNKYINIATWEKNSLGSYTAARRRYRFLIDKYFPNKRRGLTENEIKKEALKYSTRGEFQKYSPRYYSSAAGKGIVDTVCSHMKPATQNFNSRCIYAYEFDDNSVYVGLTLNKVKRHQDHLNNSDSPVFNKIKDGNNYLLRYHFENIAAKEAAESEKCLINEYRNEGWKILNRDRGGGLGSVQRLWPRQKIKKYALECKTKKEFKSKYPKAYGAACRQKLINHPEITGHMIFHSQDVSVRCIDTGEIFKSLSEAAKAKGAQPEAISRCCKGKQKTCIGLKWEYV